jgi:hypothetical protein
MHGGLRCALKSEHMGFKSGSLPGMVAQTVVSALGKLRLGDRLNPEILGQAGQHSKIPDSKGRKGLCLLT